MSASLETDREIQKMWVPRKPELIQPYIDNLLRTSTWIPQTSSWPAIDVRCDGLSQLGFTVCDGGFGPFIRQ